MGYRKIILAILFFFIGGNIGFTYTDKELEAYAPVSAIWLETAHT